MFYSRCTCLRSQSEHKIREGPAPPSVPLRGGRHGTPGLDRTQPRPPPRHSLWSHVPLKGLAGTWKPWERLHLRSTWIPTLMLFFPEHLDPNFFNAFFSFGRGPLRKPQTQLSLSSLGRRALALHGPRALSSLGFPRIPWWGTGSGPSSEALWTGSPGCPELGDGSRLQRPRLTSKSSAEPDSSFCLQGSEPTLRRGEGRGWG